MFLWQEMLQHTLQFKLISVHYKLAALEYASNIHLSLHIALIINKIDTRNI